MALVCSGWLLLPYVVQPYLKRKLQAMVADHLNATLRIESLGYRFPYGVVVGGATLSIDDPGDGTAVTLLEVERLELRLAQLPLRPGPIVVESLRIDRPVLHLVRMVDGSLAGARLAKHSDELPENGRRRLKMSDALRLREFVMNAASVRYEDRERPTARAIEWRDIDARLALTPRSASVYAFELRADNAHLADLELRGSADVDSLEFEVERLALGAQLRRGEMASELPVALQDIARRFGVEGAVTIGVSGRVPLRDPRRGAVTMSVRLDGVSASPVAAGWALHELSTDVRASYGASPATARGEDTPAVGEAPPHDRVRLGLNGFRARGLGATLIIDECRAQIDPGQKRWRLNALTGHLRADAAQAGHTGPTPASSAPGNDQAARRVLGGAIEFRVAAHGTTVESIVGRARSKATTVDTSGPSTRPVQIDELSIVARDVTVLPPQFPRPIESISGEIRVEGDQLQLRGLRARHGSDAFTITSANMPMSDWDTRVELRDIVGGVALQRPSPGYPAAIEKWLSKLSPHGAFAVRGAVALYLSRGRMEPDYRMLIAPQRASVAVAVPAVERGSGAPSGIEFGELQGEVVIAPRAIEAPYLEGTALGGGFAVKADVSLRDPMKYRIDASATDIDLLRLSEALNLRLEDGSPALKGRAVARARASGRLPPRRSSGGGGEPAATFPASTSAPWDDWREGLAARGWLRITEGQFWSLRSLDGIVKHLKIARDALTAGEAALIFDISDRTLRLKRLAISSTALGVQGGGTIALDGGALDLDLIAAPLGDWRRRIQESGIPILGDLAGELVGAVQKVINAATSELLYEFRIGGKVGQPTITTVPAPLLTDGAARLFGLMLKDSKSETLIREIDEAKEVER